MSLVIIEPFFIQLCNNKGQILNYEEGVATKREGEGLVKFYAYQKGRAEKVLSMLKWGGGGGA